MSLWDKIWGGKIWGKKKKEEEKKEEKEVKKQLPIFSGDYFFVPYISEKSLRLVKEQNVYTFLVEPKLTKHQIRSIIEKNFNVKPIEIKTINYPKRVRGVYRWKSVRKRFKKALIKLREGESLPFFEV